MVIGFPVLTSFALASASAARFTAAAGPGAIPIGVSVTASTRAGRVRRGAGASPVRMEKTSRASATLRVIAPRESNVVGSGWSCGMRSGDGRRPTTPQQLAGIRIEPPRSSAVATVARPAATAVPLPPLEPPGVWPSRQGFWVGPKSGLTVPTDATSSGVLVLPNTAAPAWRRRVMGGESPSARRPANLGEDQVQLRPFTW